MRWEDHIGADPRIMHGAFCFRGTRIPVAVVLDNLAEGKSVERILAQYPPLKAEHIPAAIAFAADLARANECSDDSGLNAERGTSIQADRTRSAGQWRALQGGSRHALEEFIARRQQRCLVELLGQLEWDTGYDATAERSRRCA